MGYIKSIKKTKRTKEKAKINVLLNYVLIISNYI